MTTISDINSYEDYMDRKLAAYAESIVAAFDREDWDAADRIMRDIDDEPEGMMRAVTERLAMMIALSLDEQRKAEEYVGRSVSDMARLWGA